MPAVTIKADGRPPATARRRWSRVRPAAPLDPDRRRQRLEPLPAVRLQAPRLPLRPGAVAPSAPGRHYSMPRPRPRPGSRRRRTKTARRLIDHVITAER